MTGSARARWGLLLLAACHRDAPADGHGASTGTATGASTTTTTDVTDGSVDTTAAATTTGSSSSSGGGGSSTSGGDAPAAYVPTLLDYGVTCKLISAATLDQPTANATHTRFNLRGTDLGIPAIAQSRLHLFFGDTVGYRVIWDFGEDPDAVASVDLAAAQADVGVLCDSLTFLVTPDVPSVAAGVDPSVERDFAGAAMTPPRGQTVAQYIAQPAGPFAFMPGTFEVPTGAFGDARGVWLFYAGLVETQPRTRATLGYLAHWSGGEQPGYTIVRPVDALVGGALGGHFIQVAPVVRGDDVLLWGTGDYRRSGVHLARVPSATLADGAGTMLWDPDTASWRDAVALAPREREGLAPLFESEGVGELSVQWIADAGVFVALYQRELHDDGGAIVDNRIVLRVATAPEGPWSDALTIIDMADPAFEAAHCCGTTCEGEQLLHCLVAGLYGAYLLPLSQTAAQGDGFVLTLPWLVSTWNPYNVVLMTAQVELQPVG
ncbi:MAG: DUF4185 domain-containing protein [Nannocystaceae bacterium]|nr:DUF4185 domain-containing protein [Nannocystaceae bacterium]